MRARRVVCHRASGFPAAFAGVVMVLIGTGSATGVKGEIKTGGVVRVRVNGEARYALAQASHYPARFLARACLRAAKC